MFDFTPPPKKQTSDETFFNFIAYCSLTFDPITDEITTATGLQPTSERLAIAYAVYVNYQHHDPKIKKANLQAKSIQKTNASNNTSNTGGLPDENQRYIHSLY